MIERRISLKVARAGACDICVTQDLSLPPARGIQIGLDFPWEAESVPLNTDLHQEKWI